MNWSEVLVALVPPAVVTVTCTVPVPAGDVAVIWVSEFTVKTAVLRPNLTLLVPVKLVPVIVTEVPPYIEPEVREILVTVGAGGII